MLSEWCIDTANSIMHQNSIFFWQFKTILIIAVLKLYLYTLEIWYAFFKTSFDSYFYFMHQFKEFIGAYNKITQMCFKDCVHDFTTRKISNAEVCTWIIHWYLYRHMHSNRKFQLFLKILKGLIKTKIYGGSFEIFLYLH